MSTVIDKQYNDRSEQLLPWYRYGWPWFLISIPFMSIALGGVMLYLAMQTNNSLVVDDYYKQGKAINVRIERDQAASLLGIAAILHQSTEGLILQLSQKLPTLPEQLNADALKLQDAFIWPTELNVRWVHVTQSERDGQTTFGSIGGNRFIAPGISLPTQGKYRVHVWPGSESAWRLVSQLQSFSDDMQLAIAAQPPEQLFRKLRFQ